MNRSAHERKQRVSAEQIARARAADPVALARRFLDLQRRGRAFFALCPFHKETRPSFKVEPGRRYKCFPCGASLDTIEFLQRMAHLEFAEAVLDLCNETTPRNSIHIVSRCANPQTTSNNPDILKASAIWHSAEPASGSPIETAYFRARGLPIPAPPSIRFVPQYLWRVGNLVLPAMIVAVQSPSGSVIAVEATALTLSCTRKAFADSRDKTGVMGVGAARFAAATDILGLAEGAETAIAAMAVTGIPTWACLGAGRMHMVAIPDHVRELHLFIDDDAAGRDASERASARHPHLRRVLRLPPAGHNDWNDFLLARCGA